MFVDDMADASNTNSGVVVQPPYLFGSTQVEVMLDTDVDYFIIPSLKKRTQPGTYFVHVIIQFCPLSVYMFMTNIFFINLL